MTAKARTEDALLKAIEKTEGENCPPGLAEAVHYAVFPGGARVRPRLCLSVAEACGDKAPSVTDAVASAIELLHCASLVHDDLPCFDDAEMRRGKPSVHRAFDERLAVLAGDALIVLAWQTLIEGCASHPERLLALAGIVAGAVGMPNGIVAGQAWECEPSLDLEDYQRAKTGSLFAAATMAGAASCGMPEAPWMALGCKLGEAYQVADDILDVASSAEELGKPIGRDAALGRPSAATAFGLDGAARRLQGLLAEAVAVIPDCPRAEWLREAIVAEAQQFVPKGLTRRAA